jgi:hypothetical protein
LDIHIEEFRANQPRSWSLPAWGKHHTPRTTHHHNTPHTNTRTLTTTRKWRGFVQKLRGFVRKLRGSVVDCEGGQPTTMTAYLLLYPYRGISRNFARIDRGRGLFQHGENTTHHTPPQHTTTHHNTPHTNTRTLTTTRKWRGFVRKLRGFVRKLRGSVVDRESGQPTAMTAYLLLYGYLTISLFFSKKKHFNRALN